MILHINGFDHEKGRPIVEVGGGVDLGRLSGGLDVGGQQIKFTKVRMRGPLEHIGGFAMPTLLPLNKVAEDVAARITSREILDGTRIFSSEPTKGERDHLLPV